MIYQRIPVLNTEVLMLLQLLHSTSDGHTWHCNSGFQNHWTPSMQKQSLTSGTVSPPQTPLCWGSRIHNPTTALQDL